MGHNNDVLPPSTHSLHSSRRLHCRIPQFTFYIPPVYVRLCIPNVILRYVPPTRTGEEDEELSAAAASLAGFDRWLCRRFVHAQHPFIGICPPHPQKLTTPSILLWPHRQAFLYGLPIACLALPVLLPGIGALNSPYYLINCRFASSAGWLYYYYYCESSSGASAFENRILPALLV